MLKSHKLQGSKHRRSLQGRKNFEKDLSHRELTKRKSRLTLAYY